MDYIDSHNISSHTALSTLSLSQLVSFHQRVPRLLVLTLFDKQTCGVWQVEGMIADRNPCLGDLIGVIKTFIHKIGITQVCFALTNLRNPGVDRFFGRGYFMQTTSAGTQGRGWLLGVRGSISILLCEVRPQNDKHY